MTADEFCRWVESAGTDWTPEEVLAGVVRGEFHLWRLPRGVLVSEFIQSPRHKVLNVWIMGGDSVDGLDDLIPQIEQFARDNGCDAGGCTGRKAWVRLLRKYGYRPADLAVEKEL